MLIGAGVIGLVSAGAAASVGRIASSVDGVSSSAQPSSVTPDTAAISKIQRMQPTISAHSEGVGVPQRKSPLGKELRARLHTPSCVTAAAPAGRPRDGPRQGRRATFAAEQLPTQRSRFESPAQSSECRDALGNRFTGPRRQQSRRSIASPTERRQIRASAAAHQARAHVCSSVAVPRGVAPCDRRVREAGKLGRLWRPGCRRVPGA